jgi:hypothetical protein
MGGFISGPIIKFQIDEASLVEQAKAALAKVGPFRACVCSERRSQRTWRAERCMWTSITSARILRLR